MPDPIQAPFKDSSIAQQMLRALLQETVNGIVFADAEGTILAFNPGAEKLFGWKVAEIIGRNVTHLMSEPYRAQHAQYLRRYLDTGERRVIGIGREVTAVHRNGNTFPVHLALGEINIEGVRQFIAVITKLTTFKEVEATVGAMRSVVRGGLKRAVRSLEGFAGKNAVLQEFDKMERVLVQAELNFKLGMVPLSFERMTIEGILDRVITTHRGELHLDGVVYQDDPKSFWVQGNRKYLDLLFQILIENSGSYSPDRTGTINVHAEDGDVVVSISNTGSIPPRWKKYLFDLAPEETAEDEGRPFGLSLVNADLVARRHGGRITCVSDEKKTTFTVHLPRA